MAYYTFPPPFYPTFTPPLYSTSATIPAPLPSLSFSHGFTPPSPSPYTPSASYSAIPPPSPNPYGYGYSSHYNHEPQPPPPYSPFPPYCQPPPYQPIDVIQRSFAEILQTSQRSLEEFTQICQKSKKDLRASNELIKASLNSIKESFEAFCKQEHFQEDEEDPQEPSEMLQEQLQEELVDEETGNPEVETETFTVEGTPPKTVDLTQLGTEVTNPQERGNTNRTTEGKKKSANPASNRQPSPPPPPHPPDSSIFTKRTGSFTANLFAISMLKSPELAAIPQLKPPDVNPIPAPPPKPPDLGFQNLSMVCQVSCEPTRLPLPSQPPDKISAQPSAPPKPPDPSFQRDDAAMPPPSRYQNRPLFPYAEYHDTPSPLGQQRSTEDSSVSFLSHQSRLKPVQAFTTLAVSHLSGQAIFLPFNLQSLDEKTSQPLNKSTICVLPASTNQSAARFPSFGPFDADHERDKASFVDMLLAGYLPFLKVHPPLFDLQRLDEMKSPPFVQNIVQLNFLQGTNFYRVVPFDSRTSPKILSSPSIQQKKGHPLFPPNQHHVPSLIAANISCISFGTRPFNATSIPRVFPHAGSINARVFTHTFTPTATLHFGWCTLNYSVAIHLSSIKPPQLLPSSPIYLLLPPSPIRWLPDNADLFKNLEDKVQVDPAAMIEGLLLILGC